MPRFIQPLAGSLLLLLAFNSQAEIYKWTDKDGRVHYSDQKPQQDSETVELSNGNSMPSPSIDVPEKSASVDNGQTTETTAVSASGQDREKKCLWARQDFDALNIKRPVYRTRDGRYRNLWGLDAYKGPRNYIEDDERPALIEEAASRVYQYCDDPTNTDEYVDAVDDQILEEQCDRLLVVIQDRQRPSSRVSKESIEEQIEEYRDYCGEYAKL